MTRHEKLWQLSVHAEHITAELAEAVHGQPLDLLPVSRREDLRATAEATIRSLDPMAAAVARLRAFEVFERTWDLRKGHPASRFADAFQASLEAYHLQLSMGPLSRIESTPEEDAAYTAGIATDDDSEAITGHGRY